MKKKLRSKRAKRYVRVPPLRTDTDEVLSKQLVEAQRLDSVTGQALRFLLGAAFASAILCALLAFAK